MFNFQFEGSQMPYINEIIRQGAENCISDSEFIVREINEFMTSPKRADMIKGINYYKGMQDILYRKRTVIGPDGEPEAVDNIPNNRIVNNQYKKMVDQKANYLLGKPIAVNSENEKYAYLLKSVINRKFNKILKNICEDSLNCGIGWLYIYYDVNGELAFRKFRPWEIIPGWADEDHTILDYAVRIYEIVEYEGKSEELCKRQKYLIQRE